MCYERDMLLTFPVKLHVLHIRAPDRIAQCLSLRRATVRTTPTTRDRTVKAKHHPIIYPSSGRPSHTFHHHLFGSDCWIRYTQDTCAAKHEVEIEKRDEFNKCSVFGADCAVDGNEFCLNGRKSVCHQVGFGSGECWIRYTAEAC
ncbi:hypothetical protein FB567DRAFT_544896 [Paraphoma chrysanthemicola]|uniref:Uncharacterized protein n=1 Tax=Paraphoma chrysanthemicola TaxID=798071 RepID=A0A8K0W387_9PLEO|nr:hypothetical protein FB567DRAFT_544896 [Paraphoma chrysanthemicola]